MSAAVINRTSPPTPTTMTDHNALIRADMRRKRKQLSAQALQDAEQALMHHITALDGYQQSLHIAGYIAHQGECNPSATMQQAWRDGKQCYLPVIGPACSMQFVRYDEHTTLTPNRYGILEPSQNSQSIAANDLDMVLVPVVAFKHTRHRLGMGMGYYDRCFANHPTDKRPLLIGLAYAWQANEAWQCHEWDIQCDQIVTVPTLANQ